MHILRMETLKPVNEKKKGLEKVIKILVPNRKLWERIAISLYVKFYVDESLN